MVGQHGFNTAYITVANVKGFDVRRTIDDLSELMFVSNEVKTIGETNWQIDVGEEDRSQLVRIVVRVGIDTDLVGDGSSGFHG